MRSSVPGDEASRTERGYCGDLDVADLESGARWKRTNVDRNVSRRDLLKAGALGTVGIAAGGSVLALPGTGAGHRRAEPRTTHPTTT